MLNIGLSPCFMYKDPTRIVFGHKNLTYMENDMVDYVSESGNIPFLIPLLEEKQLHHFLDQCDGIIFQGGVDLSPRSYGEDFLDEEKWPGDHFRDEYELKILDYCVQKKIPVFGICRGFQLINAYFKGTLHQDLSINTKTKVEHRCAEKYDHVHHLVSLENNVIRDIYGADSIRVNSVHHQGIKTLGKNLTKEAYCPADNLIEAFSFRDMDQHYILAVQWHPEFSKTLGSEIASPTPLINHFIKAVTNSKLKKGKK